MVFLHTAEDLRSLSKSWLGTADWLKESGRLTAVRGTLEGIGSPAMAYIADQYGLETKEAERVWQGKPLNVDQLGGPTHLATEAQVARARAAAAAVGVRAFIKSELTLSLHHSDNVRVFIVEDAIKLTRRRMEPVRSFLTCESGATLMGYSVIGDEDCEKFADPLESGTLQKLLFGQSQLQNNREMLCLGFIEQLQAREDELQSAAKA